MNELLQIQAYVNEMDEVNNPPAEADQVTLALSQQAKDGNLDLAKQKEQQRASTTPPKFQTRVMPRHGTVSKSYQDVNS